MKKQELFSILHYFPSAHEVLEIEYFTKSRDAMRNIKKINLNIYFVLKLFFKILFSILIFRPNKVYTIGCVNSVRSYSDILLSYIKRLYVI